VVVGVGGTDLQPGPAVELDSTVLYVGDGGVDTSAGTAAAIDLCLHWCGSTTGVDPVATVMAWALAHLGPELSVQGRGPEGVHGEILRRICGRRAIWGAAVARAATDPPQFVGSGGIAGPRAAMPTRTGPPRLPVGSI
jgi:hypothetical protein